MNDILFPTEEKEEKKLRFEVQKVRKDFPILNQVIHGKPYVYFDNSATTQKPLAVIEAERNFYLNSNSNIHRGVHYLSEKATTEYENARKLVRELINATSDREIIFTGGTTESINLVAFSFGEKYITEGDEIIVSRMEHHSNIVPWQLLCERKNAKIKVLEFDENGDLELQSLPELISTKTKLIAVTHISNALGSVNDVEEIVRIAHNHDVPVLIDGAQAIQHTKVDVQKIDCDFYVFSGHKMYAPTGIGVLYGKENFLEAMSPYKSGGEMIKKVSFEKTTYNELPLKFEAGTPNYVGAISFATAIRYLTELGMENIASHEDSLMKYLVEKFADFDGAMVYGKPRKRVGALSFALNGIHPYDTGMILDKMGIAIRTGTHCAQPVMDKLGISGTARVSFGLYNTFDEIDKLFEALQRVKQMFA